MVTFKATLAFKLSCILANLNKYRRDNPLNVVLDADERGDKLVLLFVSDTDSHSISLPIPYKDGYGNLVIGDRVVRAVGTWMHADKEYGYWELFSWMLTGRIETAFPNVSKRSQLERLVVSLDNGTAPLTFRSLQELINGVINDLPLAGTPMEAWAMCHRVCIIDPTFKSLAPAAALKYQQELNRKLFPWTSIGLSDSGMVNNNLLKTDLRCYTPFGLRHHNPMRNLYSTLGMKGDEAPRVRSESAVELAKTGVERRGWSFMTCFADNPLTFEDQLVVDNRHLDKFTSDNRRFICFGAVQVAQGAELSEGDVISVEPNGTPTRYWVRADKSTVVDITKETLPFNGEECEVSVVYVETKHAFKEGIKLTNCHGNKGVVSFADCGTMFDQARGVEVPIDIIVSARTISKRRNYGQVLEALSTLIAGSEAQLVFPDDIEVPDGLLREQLVKNGYKEDGTSVVKTPWFAGDAICGWMFWGLIKNPENQLWTKGDVFAENNRDLRRAGIKISHIELKGLTTIFGPKSAPVDEILRYQQGVEDVHELVEILEVLRGKAMLKPIIDWSAVRPLQQRDSYFHHLGELTGTVVGGNMLEDGFMLRLPCLYHVFVPDDERREVEYLTHASDSAPEEKVLGEGKNIFLNMIYVPCAKLRQCWEHPTGKWGLSDIGGFLNNIVAACHAFRGDTPSFDTLLRALNRYFSNVSRKLSTKNGEIATYVLSIRYPHSVKATATLAKEGLPENWVEIHTDMACDLRVKDGDYIIAERFPCLGFKSLRIQRVRVTDDPQCRYVIRVSGNSLVSQNLDFDGDVLFLMSFHTRKAKQALALEFHVPDALRKKYIDEANNKKQPITAGSSLNDVSMSVFPDLTAERQAEIVGGLTGIKRGTGTIVAMAYNLMRIIEGNIGYADKETNLAMEVILDTVANSVFGQKHEGKSLESSCKKAICTANLEMMNEMGFPAEGSRRLCELIRQEAKSVGVTDLDQNFRNHLTKGYSSIINLIVRKKHRFYFATRSNLNPVRLLEHIEAEPTDLTSHLWRRSLKLLEKKSELQAR